ncbi:isoamyl alcohol [Seiridium cupressi]
MLFSKGSLGWAFFLASVTSLSPLGSAQDLDMSQLNTSVDGRLKLSRPLAEPCYGASDGRDCEALKQSIGSAWARSDVYQGFQYMQGESCISDPNDQCVIDYRTLTVPPAAQCGQGVVSPYFVEVAGASDAQAVFQYARSSGATLSIKNSGHDYVMRSSRNGSIALWTRQLRDMAFSSSFTPEGCSEGDPGAAVTIGAGVDTDEAMTFAHANGVLFTGGSAGTLGAAGGWSLNGGHSAVSNTYGLAADRALQFAIITPDGTERIANRCQNQDLFWALRGGGGGAFGLVINTTYVAEQEASLVSAFMFFPGTNDNQRRFVEILAENMDVWALAGWSGPSSTNFSLLNNPLMTTSEAQSSLTAAVDYVKSQGGDVVWTTHDSYFGYYQQYINGTFATGAVVSTAEFVTSRVVPADIFGDTTARSTMIDGIFEIASTGVTPMLLTVTPYLYAHNNEGATNETSMHSAWYDSLWHIVVTGFNFDSKASYSERNGVVSLLHNTTTALMLMAPEGCTYANEADPWLDQWESAYWGTNYPRLLEIKKSIDPDNLLSCWHCVGWEATLQDYQCISNM